MALTALRLEKVTHSFGGEVLLRSVDISVQKGERVAVVGPSGQGKSTLLKILAGLIRPDEGRLFVDDLDFHSLKKTEQQKLRYKMGLLFQKNALFDSLRVGENIAFPLREVTKKTEAEIQELVVAGLESVGILHAQHLYPDEMSGGMQKRLGIARAQALRPEILFYDDPTAGLDPITSRKIIDLIIQMQQQNESTIVVVTNEVPRAFQVGQRIFYVGNHSVYDLGDAESAKKTQNPVILNFLQGKALKLEEML